MEEKIKEIISLYTKIPATQINPQTVIDRSAVASSILLHRMYAALQQEGIVVENYWEVKHYGTLLQRINGSVEQTTFTSSVPAVQYNNHVDSNSPAAAIGIDVESISSMPVVDDFREAGFYTMNFTAAEIAYCILQPSSLASFAGLFAAKEAMVKADNSYQNKPFNNISIDHLPGGKPVHPAFQLSISHTSELAIAVAIQTNANESPLPSTSNINSPVPGNKTALWLAVLATISSIIAILLLLYKS